MKRVLTMILLIFFALSTSAFSTDLGAGAFGGVLIPVVQEDQGTGSTFGIRGKIALMDGISLEPNINFHKYGDAELDFGTIAGSKITSFGVDAIVGGGQGKSTVSMYGLIGGGFYSITRDFDEDVSKLGFSAGLGLELVLVQSVGFDIRGKLDVISGEGGGTKKSAAVLGGVTYYFEL